MGSTASIRAAARPPTGREPAAVRDGSENRWLCQLRAANPQGNGLGSPAH